MNIPVLGIIQARMGSSRCPGKVLREVHGRPLVDFLMRRLRRTGELKEFLIATSGQSTDNPIADYCRKERITYFRGSLDNVASRFEGVLRKTGAEAFVRISADSPLLDPGIVDRAIRLFKEGGADLVTNVQKRTFPRGQSVEVLKAETFLAAYPLMTAPEDLEHVTSYFYKHPEGFRIRNFETEDGRDYSASRLCIDTEEEFSAFKAMAEKWPAEVERLGWRELLPFFERMRRGAALTS